MLIRARSLALALALSCFRHNCQMHLFCTRGDRAPSGKRANIGLSRLQLARIGRSVVKRRALGTVVSLLLALLRDVHDI